MNRDIGLDHGRARPNAPDQFFLGDQLAMTFDEGDKNIEGAAPEPNRLVRLQEEALHWQQAKGAKHDDGLA